MSRTLRPLVEADLQLIFEWRNHPSVRSFMFTQHEISQEEHVAWFHSIVSDSKRSVFIYEEDSTPLGVVSISIIAGGKTAEWGFYVKPNAAKGTGTNLGLVALSYFFNKLGLEKICGQALAFNDASKSFHQKLGFQNEGVLRKHYFDGLDKHDVVCYGLLRNEWRHMPGRAPC